MKKLTLLALALFPLAAACADDPTLDERSDVGPEYVGRAPDGTLTPAFATEAELRSYLAEHPDEFPEGTTVLRR